MLYSSFLISLPFTLTTSILKVKRLMASNSVTVMVALLVSMLSGKLFSVMSISKSIRACPLSGSGYYGLRSASASHAYRRVCAAAHPAYPSRKYNHNAQQNHNIDQRFLGLQAGKNIVLFSLVHAELPIYRGKIRQSIASIYPFTIPFLAIDQKGKQRC